MKHNRRSTSLIAFALAAACIESAPDPVPQAMEPPTPPEPEPGLGVPYYDAWSSSPHADVTSVSFNNWNEEGAVPTSCARCHSTEGFQDYLGADGSEAGSVDAPAPIKSEIRCEACHNDAAQALSSVTFPSGEVVTELGADARCMTCHQGRASKDSVDTAITSANVGDDEPSAELGFINIHYRPAAATLYAGQVRGGYQYEGQVYDTRFRHVEGFNSCTGCHDPHSTRVRFDSCTTCHAEASDLNGVRNIRMLASRNHDYSGDGDLNRGIYYEVQSLAGRLEQAILRYAREHGGAICYSDHHPYFFADLDGDGACSDSEAVASNRYAAFSPRLLRGAYNYQLAKKDPGAFAHNAKYVIELLHDSIQDVNAALAEPEDLSALTRTDSGHFNGAGAAARNWDTAETVASNCSRCHGGAEGYHFFQQYGVGLEAIETANGLECSTCHTNFSDYALFTVEQTSFPAGVTHTLEGDDNLCGNCHSGRASMASIDAAIAQGGALSFQNVHGGPAAGVLYGGVTQMGYQYEGKVYAEKLTHLGGTRCTTCHDATASKHTFRVSDVWETRCELCHGDYSEAREVRLAHLLDYDGDANVSESLADEIAGLAEQLLSALHLTSGSPALCYSSEAYPYFFGDTDGSGPLCDGEEASAANRFAAWTPALLRAAHNYKISQSDHGAWMHNFSYMGQLLFDSIEDLTGEVPASLVRP